MSVDRFPVEEGSIQQFARAVLDPNPIYYDREFAARSDVGSIIAPPTYVQVSAHFDQEYPLRPRLGEAWRGSGKTASGQTTESGGAGLHAEQHFEYHRPLRPGDVLNAQTIPGRTWEKTGRSGVLKFRERITEFRDPEGNLVVTARTVGVQKLGRGNER